MGRWAAAPSCPGRTIEARVNVPVRVRWLNELPTTHLLAAAVDHTLHGAERKFPEVRAVVHLHGGATAAAKRRLSGGLVFPCAASG